MTNHTHTPNPARNEALKTVVAMKERAQNTLEQSQQIIGNSVAGIQDAVAVAVELPNMNTIRRNIRRQRKVANNIPPIPMTRATLPNPLPVEYSTTNAGVQFLQWDSGDNERILIFATDGKLNLLEHNNNWFMDGTFDTVPLIYTQLLTIHAKVQGAVIPCVYALLPNKTQHTYVTLFRELININGNLRPISVLIDFELGIKNALVAVFPAVSVNGCCFHFTKYMEKDAAAWPSSSLSSRTWVCY